MNAYENALDILEHTKRIYLAAYYEWANFSGDFSDDEYHKLLDSHIKTRDDLIEAFIAYVALAKRTTVQIDGLNGLRRRMRRNPTIRNEFIQRFVFADFE